ncbi:hypothetical protein [Agrobacterium tumefaciens]|uniref:hypothetical protein n=1 Tax=Agrobacterium tumefaciens TaxID=358 RepID=UPI001571F946|nr:hypothetical protein [Agrobacterium tumefaciens]NTB05869.1 hypothetical protein [Agrobacterium tumefaciens]
MDITTGTRLKLVSVGSGTVLVSEEPDAPGFKTYITDSSIDAGPTAPETDMMQFSVFAPGSTEPEPISSLLHGRRGIVEWYVNNVGFNPDEKGKTPIGELIENTAAHMMLEAAAIS